MRGGVKGRLELLRKIIRFGGGRHPLPLIVIYYIITKVKDYLCTALVVLASIVLAVNLALSLGSGPIVCFLTEGLIRVAQPLLSNFQVCLARTKL